MSAPSPLASAFGLLRPDLEKLNEKIYNKITTLAKDLVPTGKQIERDFGIPIVNKRISVTPIALVGGAACKSPEDFVTIAKTLDRAAKTVGVNFIGGYSALVSKGMTTADENLMRFHPAGVKRDRFCLQLHQCRLHKDRFKYGCSPFNGRDGRKNRGVHKGQRLLRLREACYFLQCTG